MRRGKTAELNIVHSKFGKMSAFACSLYLESPNTDGRSVSNTRHAPHFLFRVPSIETVFASKTFGVVAM
jgi:hypothetical protein